jgi:hypothetical protein
MLRTNSADTLLLTKTELSLTKTSSDKEERWRTRFYY